METGTVGPNEYRCECCREVFEKARTDEEAAIEAVANGYDPATEDCGIVCDLCYHKNFAFLNVSGAAAMHEETRELLKADAEDFPDEFLNAFQRALGPVLDDWVRRGLLAPNVGAYSLPFKEEKEDA